MLDSEVCSDFTQAVADGYLNTDLNSRLIIDKAATYLPLAPDGGIDGIRLNDLLVVRRSLKPTPGNVILAEIQGEYCLRRLLRDRGQLMLADDKGYVPPKPVTNKDYYHGTVTYSIRTHCW